MTKETAKEYLPLVQALAEGKTIQQNCAGGWYDMQSPTFIEHPSEYRIKPEPRRWWLVQGIQTIAYLWPEESYQIKPGMPFIEVVEVQKGGQ